MSYILVVTGSIRPNSVNEKVVPLVVAELEKQGAQTKVADLQALNMPLFDNPTTPSDPNYEVAHESVKEWTRLVDEADGVVLVTPEYNHTMSPVQINAIDWIGKEWREKKVAFVGYGWISGASEAQDTARRALSNELKAKVLDTSTNLFFTKELTPEGDIADQAAVDASIAATIRELLTQ
jgi:NAD(P)H-dependent FMN reductase